MKNLVYIFADGLRADAFGEHTPHLNTFCQNENTAVISAHPLPASYRATLWTGKNVLGTGMVREGLQLYPDHRTLPQVLAEQGYATAFVGEWRIAEQPFVPRGRYRLGFDEAFFSFAGVGDKRRFYTDTPNGKPASPVATETETAVFLEQLSQLQCGRRPFAAFLNLTDSGVIPDEYSQPAFPWKEASSCGVRTEKSIPSEALQTVSDALERQRAVAFAALLDARVGAVLERTDLDNTVVVVTACCGRLYAEHCRKGSNTFFEEAIRVPFLTKGFSLSGQLLDTQDIFPVLLNAMGFPAPVPERDHVLLFGMGPERTFRDGAEWRGIRTAEHTYAVCKRDDTEYLFDLQKDPLQLENLALLPQMHDLRMRLRYAMYRDMLEQSDTFPKNSYYKQYWVEHRQILPFLR